MPNNKNLTEPKDTVDWDVLSSQPREGGITYRQSQSMIVTDQVIYYGVENISLRSNSHSLAWASLGGRKVGDIYGIVVDLAGEGFINVSSLAEERGQA